MAVNIVLWLQPWTAMITRAVIQPKFAPRRCHLVAVTEHVIRPRENVQTAVWLIVITVLIRYAAARMVVTQYWVKTILIVRQTAAAAPAALSYPRHLLQCAVMVPAIRANV